MNILRLSTLSLILAIAVFALGYNPSFADNPAKGNHPHGDGKDKTETVFLVEMQPGTLGATDNEPAAEGLVTSAGKACGSTEGELHLGAVFPDDCVATVVYFITPPTGGPLTLRLWYVQVNLNKSNVQIWFRADNENNLFVIRSLPVTINRDGSSSPFTVEVNEFDLTAERNHNPGK